MIGRGKAKLKVHYPILTNSEANRTRNAASTIPAETEGVVDDEAPSPIRLTPRYFHALAPHIHRVAIRSSGGQMPVGAGEGNVAGLVEIFRMRLAALAAATEMG